MLPVMFHDMLRGTFGTGFKTDTFDAYRKDISKRMKQKELPQIDILLVVNNLVQPLVYIVFIIL